MNITVRKYWSHTTFHDPVQAQQYLNKLQEKHEDRQYCILTNLRGGYSKYQVVQYEDVTVDFPDRLEELGPDPERPPGTGYGVNRDPAWEDYKRLVDRRKQDWLAITKPLTQKLRGKLN